MKGVDIVGAVLLDDGNDALPHSREYRSNHDRGEHADHYAQHGKEATELMTANAVERHAQRFAHLALGNLGSYGMKNLHRPTLSYIALVRATIGSNRAPLNAG